MDRTRLTDKTKTCVECDEPFVFTAGEQVFYGERLMPEPKRCPSCRKRRKKPINQTGPEVRHADE